MDSTASAPGALFTDRTLLRLLIPLLIEQTLAATIGMVNTYMVSVVSEAAISSVSLVENINLLMVNLFSALTTGGAVVSAQYFGHRDLGNARESARQLYLASALAGAALMALSLLLNRRLLGAVFGQIEPEVMEGAVIYFMLSALSYPFLAVYNAGAALYRATGDSKTSMYVSLAMNVVNITINALLILGLGWGVAGAGVASLASRALGALVMTRLLARPREGIYIGSYRRLRLRADMLGRILRLGIPNGLENSMFQFGKILVLNLISGLGTHVIAANAVGNTISVIAVLPGSATALAILTVVGQCMGAGEPEQAARGARKLMLWTYLMMFVTNLALFLFVRPLVGCFQELSPAAFEIAVQVLTFYAVCAAFLWSPSFVLPGALRGAGDVKFTMTVSIASMWIFRIGFSYLLVQRFQLGLLGVWGAMVIDWIARDALFIARFLTGGWKSRRVI